MRNAVETSILISCLLYVNLVECLKAQEVHVVDGEEYREPVPCLLPCLQGRDSVVISSAIYLQCQTALSCDYEHRQTMQGAIITRCSVGDRATDFKTSNSIHIKSQQRAAQMGRLTSPGGLKHHLNGMPLDVQSKSDLRSETCPTIVRNWSESCLNSA